MWELIFGANETDVMEVKQRARHRPEADKLQLAIAISDGIRQENGLVHNKIKLSLDFGHV